MTAYRSQLRETTMARHLFDSGLVVFGPANNEGENGGGGEGGSGVLFHETVVNAVLRTRRNYDEVINLCP